MADSHRTNQGRIVDMDTLRLKNEKVRAVGNMNVNARGDVLDSDNKNISSRNKQVNRQYRKQTAGQVRDVPVMNSKKAAKLVAEKYAAEVEADAIEGLDTKAPVEMLEAIVEKVEKAEEKATSGLAGAIAKAREAKQEADDNEGEKKT